MSLSRDERGRLTEILAENRKMGSEIPAPPMNLDHPLVEEVREVVEEFDDDGRTVFMTKHVAPHVNWQNQAIGAALHVLRREGVVEPTDDGKQTPYRWVIVE